MTSLSCDTVVALTSATVSGQTIFGKNSDRPADECQPLILRQRAEYDADSLVACQFVTLPQVRTTYRHVGSRPHWCWGYEHGFNEHQVVIGNEALSSRLVVSAEQKLIGMELVRLGLERARSAAEAVTVITDLVGSYGQGRFENDAGVRTYDNGFLIADPREAYVIEAAGHEWVVKRVEHTMGISNVYSIQDEWMQMSPGAPQFAAMEAWWQDSSERFDFAAAFSAYPLDEGSGAMRRARSSSLLSHHTGSIDARLIMSLLSDHAGEGHSDGPFTTDLCAGPGICVHPGPDGSGGCSAASLVADLCADDSRLPVYWCSLYSPCLSLFLPIFTEGNLPPVLSVGASSFDEDSPWWLFRQLNLAVLQDPAGRTSIVRDRWTGLQDRLLSTAYEVAQQGRSLIDAGEPLEASRLLTVYMADNSTVMLQIVNDLLQEVNRA